MVDGSGLSTADLMQATALTSVVRASASGGHPELRALLAGLPVAGFLGTLAIRFSTTASAAGVGAVRAKTGTLTGVSSLAGVVVDADGRQLAFAVIAGHVPSDSPLDAEAALGPGRRHPRQLRLPLTTARHPQARTAPPHPPPSHPPPRTDPRSPPPRHMAG